MEPDYKKTDDKLVEVYKDSLLLATDYPLGKTIKIDHQGFYDMKINGERAMKGNVEVLPVDTITALSKFRGDHNAVLNMASYKRPGGGVSWGAKAQEEGLFRCSNLGLCISKSHYPLRHTEALYTTGAVFFKDFNYNKQQAITCDVITCAAINLRKENLSEQDYLSITETKIRFIIKLAARNYVENLILGAWGCGVFANDPTFIANIFKKVLDEDEGAKVFNNVIFAVINDHNSVANNYEIFKQILNP